MLFSWTLHSWLTVQLKACVCMEICYHIPILLGPLLCNFLHHNVLRHLHHFIKLLPRLHRAMHGSFINRRAASKGEYSPQRHRTWHRKCNDWRLINKLSFVCWYDFYYIILPCMNGGMNGEGKRCAPFGWNDCK